MVMELATREENENADIVANVVTKGDLSGLDSSQLVRFYNAECRRLRMDPLSRPLDLLRLQGKLVLYLNRRGGDQLAWIHKVTRKIVEGPDVRDFGGTKVLYCRMQVSLPDGRVEEDVATLPVADMVNAVMKIVTKAGRRATAKICGWGGMDETEIDTVPGAQRVTIEQIEHEKLQTPQSHQPALEGPQVFSATSRILERLAAQMEKDYEQHARGHAECWRENLKLLEEEFEHSDIQSAKIKFTEALVMARFKFWDETALPLVHDENAPTVFWPLYKDLRDAKDNSALVAVWNTHKAVASKLESKEHREIAWDMACYRYGELHPESTTPPKTAFKKLLTLQPPPDGTTDTRSKPAAPPASAQGSSAEGAQGNGAQASVSYLVPNVESARYVASASEWEAHCLAYKHRNQLLNSWSKHVAAFRTASAAVYEERLRVAAERLQNMVGALDVGVCKKSLELEERTAEANARRHAEPQRKAG